MRYPYFIEGSNESASVIASCDRTVNMMPEIVGPTGKNTTVLVGTPGLTLLRELQRDSIRGMFEGDLADEDYFYCVADATLYKVGIDGDSAETVGDVGEDADSMPIRYVTGDTTADTLIVSNGTAYQLVSGVLSEISDLSGKTCLDCSYLGGYYIVITNEYLFYRSDLGDISTWDMTNYDYPDTQPEPLVGVINSQNQLWFFGKSRTSVWMLDSTNLMGMSRINNVSIRFGLWSNATLKILDNGIIWLAAPQDGVGRVCLARNFAPQKISIHSIDTILADNVSTLSTAYALITDDNGHEVYQLSIPGADTTLCYDASTQRWHERAYWTGSDYQLHLAKCSTAKNGIQYVGARNNAKVYTTSMTLYDDNGEAIRRMRRAPHIHVEDKYLTYDKMQLDVEKGLGDDGANPQMYMRYSDNGGKTYSTAIGSAMGETDDDINTIRVEWNRLGTGRDYVFEVYSTATQRHCWIDAYIN